MDKERQEYKQRLDAFAENLPSWTGTQEAIKGIVICGGGSTYFPGTWIILQQLRLTGCSLPVQVWYLGPMEMSDEMLDCINSCGAHAIDAYAIAEQHGLTRLRGWELKAFALLHTSFTQVLLLDADNLPLINPEFLFSHDYFLTHYAVFWPDVYAPWAAPWLKPETWEVCGVPFSKTPEFESGQMLIDKRFCWREIQLAWYFNAHSDYYYQFFYGDKDTFQLAWLKLNSSFLLVAHRPVNAGDHTIVQFDFLQRPLFLHRNRSKWKLNGNQLSPGFELIEKNCISWLDDLSKKWNGRANDLVENYPAELREAFMEIASAKTYRYILSGHGEKMLELMPDFCINTNGGRIATASPAIMETRWKLEQEPGGRARLVILNDGGPTCFLNRDVKGNWSGRWLSYERMEVTLEAVYAGCSNDEKKYYYDLQETLIASFPVSMPTGNGRGIIIPGGGKKYFAGAWVLINLLRKTLQCTLPIELWYLGEEEIPFYAIDALKSLDVIFRNAYAGNNFPQIKQMNGWTLKSYALLNSSFSEVLLLDADNVPVTDPAYLFETPEYKKTGAVFWPDFGSLSKHRPVWDVCGIAYRHEREFESGQLLVDRKRHLDTLRLALHYNEHCLFFYRLVNGDKETFHLAWLRLKAAYAMPSRPIRHLDSTMLQHDFSGMPLFQHRYGDKWKEEGGNKLIEDFVHEKDCFAFLSLLSDAKKNYPEKSEDLSDIRRIHADICRARFFRYERVNYDSRRMEFLPDGFIGQGNARCEQRWLIRPTPKGPILEIEGDEGVICITRRDESGRWTGHWTKHEKMEIILYPENHS